MRRRVSVMLAAELRPHAGELLAPFDILFIRQLHSHSQQKVYVFFDIKMVVEKSWWSNGPTRKGSCCPDGNC